MMWSAIRSMAKHSQFVRGARPHLYMDEQKRPTPERRRLSLTQAALGRPIPKDLVAPAGRCFPVARSVTLSTLLKSG